MLQCSLAHWHHREYKLRLPAVQNVDPKLRVQLGGHAKDLESMPQSSLARQHEKGFPKPKEK
jgi:hypothetical protein